MVIVLEPVGRDQARELARRELEKRIYRRDEPSWLERIWQRFTDWVSDLLQRSGSAQPDAGGGWVSLAVIIVVLAVAIGLVAWLMWNRRNTRSARAALLADQPSTARDHRDVAEDYAAAGRWAQAIRERLRAIARELEERVIIDPRPGRTADELAAEAGTALPAHAAELHACVRVFDDVWYGDRPGTAEGYARLTALDAALRSARPRGDDAVPPDLPGVPGPWAAPAPAERT